MEDKRRRSILQTQILAQLRARPITSIAALAGMLEASRPSLSRSLHSLLDQGLVTKDGRTWTITESGRAEADTAVAQLQESTARTVEIAGRRFRALGHVGVDDGAAVSLAKLLGEDVIAKAASVSARDYLQDFGAVSLRDELASKLSVGSTATDAIASAMGLGRDYPAEAGGLAAQARAFDAADRLRAAQAQPLLGAAMRLSETLPQAAVLLDSYKNALGVGSAIDVARELAGRTSTVDVAEAYREIGRSVTADFASAQQVVVLRASADALWETASAIATDRETWGPLFGAAAGELDALKHLSGPLYDASASLRDATAADVVARLDRITLPEPLLSDTLRTFGLNSERIHTPEYRIQPVEPMRTPSEAERRAERALLERDRDIGDTLFNLERVLRQLVASRLRERFGDEWWERGVPSKSRAECLRGMRRRASISSLHYELIEFANFDQLREIIVKDSNWADAFVPVFGDDVVLEAMFRMIAPARNDRAHARQTSDRDLKNFRFAATWLTDAADAANGHRKSDG